MKHFKELIERRMYFEIIFESFFGILGLITIVAGIVVSIIYKEFNVTIITVISGLSSILLGLSIPLLSLEGVHENEKKKKDYFDARNRAINYLSNIRLANENEKMEYIEYLRIKKNGNSKKVSIFGIIAIIIGVFFFIKFGNVFNTNFILLFGIISILIIIISNWLIKLLLKANEKKIINSKVYIAECYSSEFSIESHTSYDGQYYVSYLMKITNGKEFLDKWFSISYQQYEKYKDKTANVKLYISTEIDLYDIMIVE